MFTHAWGVPPVAMTRKGEAGSGRTDAPPGRCDPLPAGKAHAGWTRTWQRSPAEPRASRPPGGGGAGGLAYEPQQQMVRPSRRALLKPTWLPRRLGLADRGQRAGVGEEALT
jgi:hypothetical protein